MRSYECHLFRLASQDGEGFRKGEAVEYQCWALVIADTLSEQAGVRLHNGLCNVSVFSSAEPTALGL